MDERPVCVSVCVRLTVCEQLRMQIEGISCFGAPCLSFSLRKSLSYVKHPLNDLVGIKESVPVFIWLLLLPLATHPLNQGIGTGKPPEYGATVTMMMMMMIYVSD